MTATINHALQGSRSIRQAVNWVKGKLHGFVRLGEARINGLAIHLAVSFCGDRLATGVRADGFFFNAETQWRRGPQRGIRARADREDHSIGDRCPSPTRPRSSGVGL